MATEWFNSSTREDLGAPAEWFAQLETANARSGALTDQQAQELVDSLLDLIEDRQSSAMDIAAAATVAISIYRVKASVAMSLLDLSGAVGRLSETVNAMTATERSEVLAPILPALISLARRFNHPRLAISDSVTQNLALLNNKLVEENLEFVAFNGTIGSPRSWGETFQTLKSNKSTTILQNSNLARKLAEDLDAVLGSEPSRWIVAVPGSANPFNYQLESLAKRNSAVLEQMRQFANELLGYLATVEESAPQSGAEALLSGTVGTAGRQLRRTQ